MVHHPVYNRRREIISAAVTNLDIHDLGRLAATYGLARLFVITPLEDQQKLAQRILDYWIEGVGGKLNPDRSEALKTVTVVDDLSSALAEIEKCEGIRPLVFVTRAGLEGDTISYSHARKIIESHVPCFVLFGTGWGLADEIKQYADYALDAIRGRTGYNHLSVRTAAAIVLDRLLA